MVDDKRRDFWAGLLYMAVGLAFAAIATTYPMGTVSRIGPGYFPFGLGVALAGIGGFLVAGSRLGRSDDRDGGLDAKAGADREAGIASSLRVALLILAAVVAFGILIRPAGLLTAVFVLVVVSSLAGEGLRTPLRTLLLAAVAAAIAWAIFILGLGLPIQVWPAGFA